MQLVALALIHRLPGQIPELPRAAREAGKRQPHVTLALMGGIVDRDQEPFGSGRLPRKGQEAVRSPVAFPCRRGFEKLPRAAAHQGVPQHGEQPPVELLHGRVHGLVRTAAQMRRDPPLPPFELPLVE